MNKERAKELLSKRVYGSFKYAFLCKKGTWSISYDTNGITKEEDKFIRSIWKNMSGSSCYTDAVIKISKGGINESKSTHSKNQNQI